MEELNEQDIGVIDRFILGKATSEDLTYIEKRRTDPEFAEHLAFVESTMLITQYHEEQQLRKSFQEKDRSAPPLPSHAFRRTLVWIFIGLISVALVYLIYTKLSSPELTPQQYFAQFYEPMPNVVAPIEQGAGSTTTYGHAFRSYERGNYDEAIRLFEEMDSRDSAAEFYYSLSLLANGQTDSSIPLLISSRSDTSSQFSHAAHWYLILAYLNSGDEKSAKDEVEQLLQNREHRYYRQAEELYERMR